MSFFYDAIKPQSYQDNLKAERQQRTRREGSPPYVWKPGIIATTASSQINVGKQFPACRKYEPLDSIEIINNEPLNDITISINGEADTWKVNAKTIRAIDNQAVWTVKVTNDGAGNTTAGNIVITIRKAAMTADGRARLD